MFSKKINLKIEKSRIMLYNNLSALPKLKGNLNKKETEKYEDMKKIIVFMLIFASLMSAVSAEEYEWAREAVDYCVEENILHGTEDGSLELGNNITNEQTAKILSSAFLGKIEENVGENIEDNEGGDIPSTRWSYPYITVFNNYTKNKIEMKNITAYTTREEFVSALVLASGLTEANIRNRDILKVNFKDYKDVGEKYEKLICIATERGYMKGSDGYLNPKDNITRAEACSLIYRVARAKKGETLELGVIQSETFLKAPSKISVEQAIKWAEKSNASEMFIEAAAYYWKYGELTGICPEILYAQSAKETKFGNYGGSVLPEQNNFAGIKVFGATGDATYDHESFATIEDGVRGHFNHMMAYTGGETIGEPHQRYFSTSKMKWAGTVKTLEELGGKWCPDLYYGYSILHNYIEPMMNTK